MLLYLIKVSGIHRFLLFIFISIAKVNNFFSSMVLEKWSKNKLLWVGLISASMGLVAYNSTQTMMKWSLLPVITTFSQIPTSVWEIPFPAITICAENKLSNVNYTFTSLYHKNLKSTLTKEETKLYGILSLVCDNKVVQYLQGNNTVDEDVIKFLVDVNPPLTNMCYDFYWEGQRSGACKEQLTPILTEEGVCYTFNIVDRNVIFKEEVNHFENFGSSFIDNQSWSLDDGYVDSDSDDIYPKRTTYSGAKSGVAMILGHHEKNQDFLCKVPVTGFKISVHSPGDVPRPGSHYIRVAADQEVLIKIKPKSTQTSSRLQSFTPDDRHCYFQNEKNLLFFKKYTQKNCELECIANVTLQLCGCVTFYMPRLNSTAICGPGSITCVREAQSVLFKKPNQKSSITVEDVTNSTNENVTDTEPTSTKSYWQECRCLQSCNTLEYEVKTTQARFEWKEYFRAMERTNKSKIEAFGIRFSKINIFFEESHFVRLIRNEFWNKIDFLAYSGAFLAFFTGFSIFTFVEIGLDVGEMAKNAFSSNKKDEDEKDEDKKEGEKDGDELSITSDTTFAESPKITEIPGIHF